MEKATGASDLDSRKLKRYLFLQRLAFIANIFFVVCLVIRYNSYQFPQFIVGFSVIMGWFLSPLVNFVALSAITLRVLRRGRGTQIPRWLLFTNFFFFIFQLVYFFMS